MRQGLVVAAAVVAGGIWYWSSRSGPAHHAEVQVPTTRTTWSQRIETGKTFYVVLDRTERPERTGWPLGTIRGGTYAVRYRPSTHAFEASGFNGSLGRAATFTYVGGERLDNTIVIWGHEFAFRDESGLVYDADLGLVGHLALEPVTAGPQGVWRDRIQSGRPFHAVLDGLQVDDNGFRTDQADPLGTLLVGATYDVTYVARTKSFVTRGFNESTNGVGEWSYDNAHLDQNEISLWGVILRFDATTGALLDDHQVLVGRLLH